MGVSAGVGGTELGGASGATGGTSRGFSKLAGSLATGSGGKPIGPGTGVTINCASVTGGAGFWGGWGSDMVLIV